MLVKNKEEKAPLKCSTNSDPSNHSPRSLVLCKSHDGMNTKADSHSTEIKRVGRSGQISLGKRYAGKTLRENLGITRPVAGAWKSKPQVAAE